LHGDWNFWEITNNYKKSPKEKTLHITQPQPKQTKQQIKVCLEGRKQKKKSKKSKPKQM